MRNTDKTKQQLINELVQMRQRITELEVSEAERKQMEEEIWASRERYRHLFENLNDAAFIADAETGQILETNWQGEVLLGMSRNEIVGIHQSTLHPPGKAEEYKQRFATHIAKGRAANYDGEVIRKDGTIIPVSIGASPLTIHGRRLILGLFHDITGRRQTEEALRVSQEALWKMFESVTDGITVIDLNGVVTEVNQRTVEIHGFASKDELLGKSAFEFVAPRDHERIATNMRKAVKQGTIRGVEYTLLKADGSEFPGELSTSVLKDASGNPVGHITVERDITERKRMEEEREGLEQKAHLASRLASVGEMASGIAHEINNPLTAVIGFAQLLMDADLPDEVKEDIGIIYEEAQRAAGVAKSLLTFARKHAPVKQLTNINGIIDGVLKLRAYEQRVNNIQVNTQFAPKLPEVMADYSQMEQVFLNIIINAETAMLEANNGGTLSIITQKVNATIRASFTDNGPGIDKENLEHVFDPFFTTKEVGKGTGLGLSVCHGIVVEHGGRIYAKSKPGKGATFVVELPTNAH